MAIAPSKLGRFVFGKGDADLLRDLREAGLVVPDARDDELIEVFEKSRREHAALSKDMQLFNSPEERIRVFLGALLSPKGKRWAVPLESLHLPDE